MTTYARPESLAETAWLAERIADPGLRVIEVDEDTTAYHNGHIPGRSAGTGQPTCTRRSAATISARRR